MGLFSSFKSKTPKTWTGKIVEKKIRKINDLDGDEVSRFTVVIDLDGDTPKQVSLDINHELYDKSAVGNKVVKNENGKPAIQVGS